VFNSDDKCVYIVGGHSHWKESEEKIQEPYQEEEEEEEEDGDKNKEEEKKEEEKKEEAKPTTEMVWKRKRYDPTNLTLVDKYDTVKG